MKHILALFFSLLSFCSLFAQTLYTRQETITITQDSVTLQVGQFRGALLWQRSLDGKNWNNLAGKTNQSLKVIKSDEGYYRAEIIENTCNPVYSDTAIIKLNIIKNITASDGGNIEMSDKTVLVIPANALQTDGNVSIGSIIKDEQTAIPNKNLEIFGKSYKLGLPGDSLLHSVTLTFNLETLPVPIENYALFLNNGNSYFPIEYTINGNTVTAIIDNINWGNNTIQSLKSTEFLGSTLFIVGLKKKESPPSEELGLKQVSISVNGDLQFTEPLANPDSKILLLIHGILSSPSNAWETFIKDVTLQIPTYSKVWTFGYNSNLSIDENALILKNALAAKTNEAKVDIVAHSMGGLVSRAMIENNDGAKYVNKLISLGTPHLGTPTKVIRLYVGFIVSLDSYFSLTPYYSYLTVGLGDLDTNSSFIQKMKQNINPPLPYYLIAAINNPNKFFNASAYISGFDDGVVANSSAQGVLGCTDSPLFYIDAGMAHTQMTNINNDVYPQVLAYLRLSVPNVTTLNVSDINSSNAIGGGTISSNGGAVITAKGVCWSPSENPTIGNWKTSEGTGNSSFTSNITGLAANTTYFVRAYATNSAGIAYGNQQSFTTTSPIITQPTVTTNSISAITQTTATSGGNIISDGGAAVTERGICWSTLQNPTTASSKISNGTGTGSFTSNLIGLSANTNYYVRAYASNSQGISYGNQQSFTTTSPIITQPTVTTNSISAITQTTATSGGNVTSDGGAAVTSRGVCWSTSQNPTTANSKTFNGIGAGIFISNLTGLIANTTYYIRAYATNSVGTAYGNQQTITTTADPNTVTDIDGNVYHTITIGTQVWMVENLKTTRYKDGTSIPNVTDNTEWANLSSPAYCWYNNDINNKNPYGALYNWYTVNTGKLAPTGWHAPTRSEMETLITFLGGYSVACGKLKETGTTHFQSPNTGATNETGFTALPGGFRNRGESIGGGAFEYLGGIGDFWGGTLSDLSPCYYIFAWSNAGIGNGCGNPLKTNGYSVRCIKD